MAYKIKTWTDRVSEFPNRRTLTDQDGGSKTYTVARNEGVVSAEGDAFSAANMNDLETRINETSKVTTFTLRVASWTAESPYTQSVSVEGMLATDQPTVSLGTPTTLNAATYTSLNRAFGCIDRAVTSNGSITFYCFRRKPEVDIPVMIKGV